jgi:hypothetical protein
MIKKYVTFGLTGLVLLLTQAQASNIEVLFGNTVELTTITPQGKNTMFLFYNPNGTVTSDSGDAYTWEIRGDTMCTQFKFARPGGEAEVQDSCSPLAGMEGAAPGDTWEATPTKGITVKGKLVAGR